MNQDMINQLDKFFSEKTTPDVDRNTFLICNLNDRINTLTISLVFMRDWHTLEYDDYNQIVLKNRGCIFVLPSYWVSIPKELALTYIQALIDNFYNEEVSKWNNGSDGSGTGSGSGDGSSSGNGCPCKNPSLITKNV